MKTNKTFLYWVVCGALLLIHLSGQAQDVHLSQYYTSNLYTNPAYTGKFDGDIKLTLNSRSQWSQVYSSIKTNMFSFEKKIVLKRSQVGVGLLFVNDQIDAYYLKTNKVYLSASYEKNFNGHSIRIGLQGGTVFRNVDLDKQTFPDQWNYPSGIYDPSIPNNETHLQNSRIYSDFNAGIGWSRKMGKFNLSAGYSIFHLNTPVDGFIKSDNLKMRHVLNVAATRKLNETLSITPQLFFMTTATATDFMALFNLNKRFTEKLGIMGGAGIRGSTTNPDAFIAMGGFSYKRLSFGLSYDFNMSSLSVDTRNKSAWEISLIYITPGRLPGKMTIPCDRY